jgi:hypothetical protein
LRLAGWEPAASGLTKSRHKRDAEAVWSEATKTKGISGRGRLARRAPGSPTCAAFALGGVGARRVKADKSHHKRDAEAVWSEATKQTVTLGHRRSDSALIRARFQGE